MRDPFTSHHAPTITVQIRTARGFWVPYAIEWTLAQAQGYIAQAIKEGYTVGRIVNSAGTVLQEWPEPEVDGPDCAGTPPDDEGGFAIVRRRRRGRSA